MKYDNQIIAYYTTDTGILATPIYLDDTWVEGLSSGFGLTAFGLYSFGH